MNLPTQPDTNTKIPNVSWWLIIAKDDMKTEAEANESPRILNLFGVGKK
jgi:hypothetical protein